MKTSKYKQPIITVLKTATHNIQNYFVLPVQAVVSELHASIPIINRYQLDTSVNMSTRVDATQIHTVCCWDYSISDTWHHDTQGLKYKVVGGGGNIVSGYGQNHQFTENDGNNVAFSSDFVKIQAQRVIFLLHDYHAKNPS